MLPNKYTIDMLILLPFRTKFKNENVLYYSHIGLGDS